MSVWHVHRDNGVITFAGQYRQPGYADEPMADNNPELQAFLTRGQPPDPSNADNLEKALKAVLLAAAVMSGKTVAQAKAALLAAWKALP